MTPNLGSGPLHGVRIVELAAIGPGPFCGMVLAGLGAELIRVDRTGSGPLDLVSDNDPMNRSRRSIALDLKSPDAVEIVLRLAETAEGLFEGFRPGVAERLKVGPEQCLPRNPQLVYGRMTGWGQAGPLASTAGHDIDYLAVAGVLHAIGEGDRPTVPLNLVADFGGGGLLLALGMVAAILHARETGRGQVVDAAMVDGVALLTAMVHGGLASGWWQDERATNLLDGAAPFYTIYEAGDGKYLAVGALEPQFFAALLEGLGIDPGEVPAQMDRAGWPAMRERFTAAFHQRARDEWSQHFTGTDACVAPVLSFGEAIAHPHLQSRDTFIEVGGVRQPAPAPRFSVSGTTLPTPPVPPGQHSDVILAELGYGPGEIGKLRAAGAVR